MVKNTNSLYSDYGSYDLPSMKSTQLITDVNDKDIVLYKLNKQPWKKFGGFNKEKVDVLLERNISCTKVVTYNFLRKYEWINILRQEKLNKILNVL